MINLWGWLTLSLPNLRGKSARKIRRLRPVCGAAESCIYSFRNEARHIKGRVPSCSSAVLAMPCA